MPTSPQEKIDVIRAYALSNYLKPEMRNIVDKAQAYIDNNGVISPYYDQVIKDIYKFIHRKPENRPARQGYSPLVPDMDVIRHKIRPNPPQPTADMADELAAYLAPKIEQAEQDRQRCIDMSVGILKDQLLNKGVEHFLKPDDNRLWYEYWRIMRERAERPFQ